MDLRSRLRSGPEAGSAAGLRDGPRTSPRSHFFFSFSDLISDQHRIIRTADMHCCRLGSNDLRRYLLRSTWRWARDDQFPSRSHSQRALCSRVDQWKSMSSAVFKIWWHGNVVSTNQLLVCSSQGRSARHSSGILLSAAGWVTDAKHTRPHT